MWIQVPLKNQYTSTDSVNCLIFRQHLAECINNVRVMNQQRNNINKIFKDFPVGLTLISSFYGPALLNESVDKTYY